MKQSLRCLAALILALLTANAALTALAVDYEQELKTLFKERCVTCHGSVKQAGDLRLDAGALILAGGSQPVVVPGKSNSSELVRRVLSDDEADRMPPEDRAAASWRYRCPMER